MRDPNRIPQILHALETLWRAEPDLRLGQLLVNATNMAGCKTVCPEIFYAEDDVLLAGLTRYSEMVGKARSTPPSA